MKNVLLSLSFFALFLTGFLFVGAQHAAAATWCGVMADPVKPIPARWDANCLAGQYYVPGALSGVGNASTSSATLKANFINYINNKSSSGYHFQKVGASFIKNHLDSSTGTWVARLNNPAVTLRVETYNSCFKGVIWPNTAYDPASDSVVNDNGAGACVSATALVIRSSGVVTFAIKYDCGNPMGNLGALPTYDWTLTGTSSVSPTSAKPGGSATFKHTVKNSGPSTATYTWRVQKKYGGAGWSYLTNPATVTTAKGSSNPNAVANKVPLPSVGVFCQRIEYTNSDGPAGKTAYSAAACVTVSIAPPPPLAICPNLPGVNPAAVGGVSFPTAEPNGSPPPSPPNGYTYYTRPVIGHALVSARDAYTGMGLSVNSAALTVDFRPAVAAYPYDSQLANVTYTNTYQLYSHTWVVTYTNIYNVVTKKWVLTATGGYWSTGGGGTLVSAQHSDGQTGMGECYRRGFTVTSVSPGNVSLDNQEDPTRATAGGASATVTFDYNGGPTPTVGMRTPMKIQLNYSWQFDSGCSGNGSFTVTGGYGAGSATGFIPVSPSCPASAPPLQAGDVVCISYTVDPATGEMTSNGSPLNSSGSVDSSQVCSAPVVDMPYAHFFGLDVSAGGNFDSSDNKCLSSVPAPSGIDAFVKGTGPLVRGSAVQYGALALGPVNSFGSASLRPTIPTARDGLTFANQGTLGNLGTTHCVPDYFGTKPTSLTEWPTDVSMAPFDSSSVTTPQQFWYGRAGGTTVNGFSGVGQGIKNGNRIAIYITGDAYITKDIRFKLTPTWSSPADVPSFYLIATGNIYISPNVSQLDGVYVAQGGTINTCAPGFSAYSAATLYDNCTNQLTVNGAFVAKKVNLYRTFASLRNSQGGESPLGPLGPDNCTINGARSSTYDCAAEVFNFSPETFLSKPALGSPPSSGITKYDFISSFSPVL